MNRAVEAARILLEKQKRFVDQGARKACLGDKPWVLFVKPLPSWAAVTIPEVAQAPGAGRASFYSSDGLYRPWGANAKEAGGEIKFTTGGREWDP